MKPNLQRPVQTEFETSIRRAEGGFSNRSDVMRVVKDLAQALATRTSDANQRDKDLARVLPGATLFFAHLSQLSADEAHRRCAIHAADRCAELVGRMPMQSSLYGGLAGMAWLFAHLERLGIGEMGMDLDPIDDLLMSSAASDAVGPYDLIGGPVGLGVYFLEHLPAPTAREGLRQVIRRLAEIAEHDERGMRWFTPRECVPPLQIAELPTGKYDLGMAHGVPGVIALLALALVHGADRQPAEQMLREAVRWMMGQRGPAANGSVFGAAIDPRSPGKRVPTRSAWCYGDPGVAASLALAARALDDPALLRDVRMLAHHAAKRAEVSSGAVDVSLCHGSAGLAHVFRMLGSTLGDESLFSSADTWYQRTLTMRRPAAEGVAGFVYMRRVGSDLRAEADPSFLEGAAGVGLSLLGAIDPASDRSWDRMLLLS